MANSRLQQTNCHLGTSSPEDPTEHRIIGKHSAPSQRPNRITPDLVLNILRANDLLAPTTYFRHKSYTTHAGNGFAREPRQIDYFFASQNLKKVILDARSIGNGVDSDHTALNEITCSTRAHRVVLWYKNSKTWYHNTRSSRGVVVQK